MLRDEMGRTVDGDSRTDAGEHVEQRLARQCVHAHIAECGQWNSQRICKRTGALGIGCAVGVVDPRQRDRHAPRHASRETLCGFEHALVGHTRGKKDRQQAFAAAPARVQHFDEVVDGKLAAPFMRSCAAMDGFRRQLGTGWAGGRSRTCRLSECVWLIRQHHRARRPRLGEHPAHGSP